MRVQLGRAMPGSGGDSRRLRPICRAPNRLAAGIAFRRVDRHDASIFRRHERSSWRVHVQHIRSDRGSGKRTTRPLYGRAARRSERSRQVSGRKELRGRKVQRGFAGLAYVVRAGPHRLNRNRFTDRCHPADSSRMRPPGRQFCLRQSSSQSSSRSWCSSHRAARSATPPGWIPAANRSRPGPMVSHSSTARAHPATGSIANSGVVSICRDTGSRHTVPFSRHTSSRATIIQCSTNPEHSSTRREGVQPSRRRRRILEANNRSTRLARCGSPTPNGTILVLEGVAHGATS